MDSESIKVKISVINFHEVTFFLLPFINYIKK